MVWTWKTRLQFPLDCKWMDLEIYSEGTLVVQRMSPRFPFFFLMKKLCNFFSNITNCNNLSSMFYTKEARLTCLLLNVIKERPLVGFNCITKEARLTCLSFIVFHKQQDKKRWVELIRFKIEKNKIMIDPFMIIIIFFKII